MLIKNRTKGAINIGVQIKKADKNDKTLGKNQVKMITLIPGNNEILDIDWKSLKEHPQIKKLMASDGLTVVTEKDRTDKELEADGGDKSLPAKAGESVVIVKATFNKELLEKWLESEDRPSVVKAINDQFKVLELTPEERAAMQGK